MNIKERLKIVLDSQKLTITDAALTCGIPYRSLQNYLRGEREPKADALILIGTQLGVNIDWLLTGRGKMCLSTNDKVVDSCSSCEYLNDDENIRARKWLDVFKTLDEEGQKNILQDIEKEKQQTELRQQLKGLQDTIEDLKRAI